MKQKIISLFNIKFVLIVCTILSFMYIQLPGLYMDAINPDYMAAYIENPNNVPVWSYNDNIIAKLILNLSENPNRNFPVLNSLYGTCIPAYIMLLWAKIFGYSVFSIRILHVIYTLIMVIGFYCFLSYITENKKIATFGALLFSIDPSVVFGSRTQYYLQLFPYVFFFFGLILLVQALYDDKADKNRRIIGATILFGLSAAQYFVFAFYFVAIFLVFILFVFIKKDKVLKKVSAFVVGGVIGYAPYLYGHISILLTEGFSKWKELLLGLDTYGISNGQTANFMERIRHIVTRLIAVSGGDDVIYMITGKNIGKAYGIIVGVVFITTVVLSTCWLLKFRMKIFKSKILTTLLLLDSMFVWHVILAIIVGNSLGYQHFIMLLPIMYLTIILTVLMVIERYNNKASIIEDIRHGLCVLLSCGIFTVSICQIVEGYSYIKETRGISYYSETINDIGYFLNSTVSSEDVIVAPQWGYWMTIACLTNGEKTIWGDTSEDVLQWRIDTNEKIGKYYILVDNQTDQEMVYDLLKSKNIIIDNIISFNDYEGILSPTIWVGEVKEES